MNRQFLNSVTDGSSNVTAYKMNTSFPNLSMSDSFDYSSIGPYHNGALDYFFQNNDFPMRNRMSKADFISVLMSFKKYSETVGISQVSVDIAIERYINYLESNSYFISTPNGVFLDLGKYTNIFLMLSMVNNLGISLKLYNCFDLITNNEVGNIGDYISNLNSKDFPAGDAVFIAVAKSLYKSSHAYWGNNGGYNPTPTAGAQRLTWSQSKDLADLMGGLAGCWLGGVGALLTGYAVSAVFEKNNPVW